MTSILSGIRAPIVTDGVYAPQQDSHLLIQALRDTTAVAGRHVLDLCTGSGVVAIAAAEMEASSVSAWDINASAVGCARLNSVTAGVDVDVRLGSIDDALRRGPYDVVVCNPPYVPTPAGGDAEIIDPATGSALAWDAGDDGRSFLDPLCEAAPELLGPGGTVLIVHSEFANARQTVRSLRRGGLFSNIVANQMIPFGPVLTARATWLEESGRLERGRRVERLIVVRGQND